jgi:hypothetical protein
LNLFLDDCKDVQDLGTKFHYSWILILIALIGWKELKYSFFSTRPNPFHGARYLSLGSALDPKNRKANAAIFEGYLSDLQDNIANTWRVTQEEITQYQGIANFKATRHVMWIQVWKDIDNQWLQLWYCINRVDIEMPIKD